MRTDLLRSTLYLNIGTRYLKKMKEFYTSIPTLLFTTRLAFHIARRMNHLSRRLHTHQADIVGIKDRRRIDSHKLDINNGATSKREWIKHFSRYPISNACRSGVEFFAIMLLKWRIFHVVRRLHSKVCRNIKRFNIEVEHFSFTVSNCRNGDCIQVRCRTNLTAAAQCRNIFSDPLFRFSRIP